MGLPTRLASTFFPPAFLMPGASLTTDTVSEPKPPDNSLVEPARMMMATSSEPLPSSAAWKPAAMDSSAINTSVTPPTPSTATSDEDQRCGIFRRFMAVTAQSCRKFAPMIHNKRSMVQSSDAPQRIDYVQPHRGQCRPGAGDDSECQHQRNTHHERGSADAK